jgi:hypothetical protein
MKKVLFTAFAGFCLFSSILATSPHQGKIKGNQRSDQYLRDSIPVKKADTSHIPKQDTMAMPQVKTQGVGK